MIPIADPEMTAAEIDEVTSVLEGGQLADGDRVRAFEDAFAAYCGTRCGVATSNGTTALHTALHAVGIGPGDRVVTTPFSFIATANAIRHVGAEPVFADVDPVTYNLDPDCVEALLRREGDTIDALVVVHLYGLPADMRRFTALADGYDLRLIEDAAQAHGATVDGQRVGSMGDAAAFSFYPTKNMTTGEGGMVTTDAPAVAERARRFVDHGRTEGYTHTSVGYNFRMTSIAAAIGTVQLARLPRFTERRRENAAYLSDALADSGVTVPQVPADRTHVYHQYTIRSERRDALRTHLADCGVGTGVYYPLCIHQQPAYATVETEHPTAERLTGEVLSLPVHPGVSRGELEQVAEAVGGFGPEVTT